MFLRFGFSVWITGLAKIVKHMYTIKDIYGMILWAVDVWQFYTYPIKTPLNILFRGDLMIR